MYIVLHKGETYCFSRMCTNEKATENLSKGRCTKNWALYFEVDYEAYPMDRFFSFLFFNKFHRGKWKWIVDILRTSISHGFINPKPPPLCAS